MSYRKLRIAWSVFWAVACVLLIVLWVRSYWRHDQLMRGKDVDYYFLSSRPGLFVIEWVTLPTPTADEGWDFSPGTPPTAPSEDPLPRLYPSVRYNTDHADVAIYTPYWLLVLVLAHGAAVPWMRYRFSLRALLIAMTLVAVVLGLIVAVLRWPAG